LVGYLFIAKKKAATRELHTKLKIYLALWYSKHMPTPLRSRLNQSTLLCSLCSFFKNCRR